MRGGRCIAGFHLLVPVLGGVGTMFWVGYMYRGISGGIVLTLCTLGLTALFWFMFFALTE